MASSPFARVGDRFSLKPILSIKVNSALKISAGVRFESTRISSAMIPFVIIASLSAVKYTFPSLNSALTQTRDWQPFIRFVLSSAFLRWAEALC